MNNDKNDLAVALDSYTNPSSVEYDPVFDAEIRRIRPDWFYAESEKYGELRIRLPLSEFEELENAVKKTWRTLYKIVDDNESVYSIAIDYWDQEAGSDYSIKVHCCKEGGCDLSILPLEHEAIRMTVEDNDDNDENELVCSYGIIDTESDIPLVREIAQAARAKLVAQLRETVLS